MSIPLDFVADLPKPPADKSLGDFVAEHVTDCGRVKTFLDCIPTTDDVALYSPDTAREPLRHRMIHDFILIDYDKLRMLSDLGPISRYLH